MRIAYFLCLTLLVLLPMLTHAAAGDEPPATPNRQIKTGIEPETAKLLVPLAEDNRTSASIEPMTILVLALSGSIMFTKR